MLLSCRCLSDLFNYSVESGIFPLCFKISTIIPLHKSSDKHSEENYRPISLITFISKIFEKLMTRRMNSFIKENRILSDNQFGFREGRSTSDAVLELVNDAAEALDRGDYCVAVFVDLRKAFDTVNHGLLLKKLDRMGFRGLISRWLSSYLSDRKIMVSVNGILSEKRSIGIGLPQGAVCSPILFLMYINDMVNFCGSMKCTNIADDTTLSLVGDDLFSLCQRVSNDLDNVYNWLTANRLSLNVDKTKFIVFSQRDNQFSDNISVYIKGASIERVRYFKFLGIYIDDQLKFRTHINNVCSKLSKSLGVLYRMSAFVPANIVLTLYNSLFYPHLIYGIEVWGRSGVVNIGRIEVVYRKAVRLLNSVFIDEFLELDLLSVENVIDYFILLKTFKLINFESHSYFTDRLINLQPNHLHTTRFSQSLQLNIPHYKTALSQKLFLYQAVKLWNQLPASLCKTCK